MKRVEPCLRERAGRMYRRLLLLQRLFQPARDADEDDPPGTDDAARDMAVGAAVREVLDELAEHARLLTTVPFPLCEWRPGDAGDDQRWRALTEVERREVLSLVAGYDDLITWAESVTSGEMELAALLEVGGGTAQGAAGRPSRRTQEAVEYLKAERARIRRFRQDMGFLSRRAADD